MRAQLSNRDYEQLSAYLDGQLAPGEKRKLEERLRVRPELQAALDELGQTRALIRMAPRRKAPRNFTLTPAMVGDAGPSRKRSGGGIFSLFPALSFASAVATLVLVATLIFEIGPGGLQTPAMETQTDLQQQAEGADMRAMEPQPTTAAAGEAPSIMAVPAEGEPSAKAGTDQAGEPIVVWGDPYSPAPSGMGGMSGGAPDGRGGGGDMGGIGGMGGGPGSMGGGAPDGSILVPQEGITSLETESAAGEEAAPQAAGEPAATQVAEAPAEPQDANGFADGGPILGLPSDEQSGQIVGQSSQGQPVPGVIEQAPAAPAGAFEPEQDAEREALDARTAVERPGPLGLSFLRWLQILLVLIAISTGLAAFLVRRRARS